MAGGEGGGSRGNHGFPRAGLARAQLAAVAAFVAVGVVSIGSTLDRTWSFLGDQRASYADLTRDAPNIVPEFQALLPVSVTNFFASRLRRGDRFYLQAADGPFIAGVDYPTAVQTFARFELLPAVAVSDPQDADVVLSLGPDPRELGLRYSRIERSPDRRYAVARVRR